MLVRKSLYDVMRLCLTVVASTLAGTSLANTSFTFVALPDTQNYVNSVDNAPLFTQQTQWIADQIQFAGNPRNIQFVSHLGDVVANASDLVEWQRADASMDLLDDVVKYAVLPGNHDYTTSSSKISGTDNYLDFFGPERFVGKPWYGGADPSGNNSFHRFSAGGFDFLHLALEWNPTINVPFRETSPIEWAQSVIDANPNTPVILSTHEYVSENPAGRSSPGEQLWNELVRSNDQVFLVLNGHFHSFGKPFGGQHHQVSTNDAGRPVFEVLQNYQGFPAGGEGWLRLINFDIAQDQLLFETFSPVLDESLATDVGQLGTFAGQFEFDIDFATRLVPIVDPPTNSGDLDGDGTVDGADFLLWQRGEPLNPAGLFRWQEHYGNADTLAASSTTVPEPRSWALLLAWCAGALAAPRKPSFSTG